MPTLSDVTTLTSLLVRARETFPKAPLSFVGSDGEERTWTTDSFAESASRVAAGFRGMGVSPGQPVLVVSLGAEYFALAFWGALLLGAKPVPMAPEPRRLGQVWELLEQPPIATTSDLIARPDVLFPDPDVAQVLEFLSIEDALSAQPLDAWHEGGPGDVALLQFSSGSTRRPRGIMLTHHNVIENVRQMVSRLEASSQDVLVNWMPLYHDMGLIGGHIAPLAIGASQIKLSAQDVARDPVGWWRIVHRHAASILLAANMSLAASARRVSAEAIAELEFSSVRAMVLGAEHISWRVLKSFFDRFVPRGLSPDALLPAYGLAEATLAVTMAAPGEGVTVYQFDREALAMSRRAELTGDPHAARFIDLGAPLDGVEVRVVDDAQRVLSPGSVGEVQVRGDSVALGYWGEPHVSSEVFGEDGWLRTGDVGVLLEGRVCITGRERELIILDGHHFFASDLEDLVREASGWGEGRALVVGVFDEDIGAERVVCFVAQRGASVDSLLPRLYASRAALREAVGLSDVTMMILPGEDFPRTTSGKLRRVTLQHR
ncbi:MAG: AMP-binding protein, partial [Myxococcota bacterium]